MKRIALGALAGLMVSIVAGCTMAPVNRNPHADDPLVPVAVDLPRYMGRWYVIASMPMVNERDYVGNYAVWTLRADGRIEDAVVGRRQGFDQPESGSTFIAVPEHGARDSVWKVHPFWPFEIVVFTAYVDPDYEYTVRATPDKDSAWILSRHPDMREQVYRSVLTQLDAMGFDTTRFKRIPQFPEQLGQPGFYAPR